MSLTRWSIWESAGRKCFLLTNDALEKIYEILRPDKKKINILGRLSQRTIWKYFQKLKFVMANLSPVIQSWHLQVNYGQRNILFKYFRDFLIYVRFFIVFRKSSFLKIWARKMKIESSSDKLLPERRTEICISWASDGAKR